MATLSSISLVRTSACATCDGRVLHAFVSTGWLRARIEGDWLLLTELLSDAEALDVRCVQRSTLFVAAPAVRESREAMPGPKVRSCVLHKRGRRKLLQLAYSNRNIAAHNHWVSDPQSRRRRPP